MLYQFQEQAYDNKVRRGFNVTDVGKEILLITEEFGELCEASLSNDLDGIVDALGDAMVYGLGLAAMFKWNADDVLLLAYQKDPTSIQELIPYLGRTIGGMAKTYKKSNKQDVAAIDNREQFKKYVGELLGYCRDGFKLVGSNEESVLRGIVTNNKTRTHQGKI